jgi:putative hydrolase of HD superfamily
MKRADGEKIIYFLHQSERLKTVLRHSWLSSGRRESVAEHSWRMALMAMLIEPYLEEPIDLLKAMKLAIVHDLVEINYKDNPAFRAQPKDKAVQERKSIRKLVKSLPAKARDEILQLWEEYEAGKTIESKFAKALDKTEVLLQHNEADLKHLTKKEYSFNFHHGLEHTEYDKFLKEFRQLISQDILNNYRKNKVKEELYKDFI